uniref:transmembrane protein 108 n=1 Tax=Myxine glutinosa TaxID=7769 RepID=UPI00358F0944
MAGASRTVQVQLFAWTEIQPIVILQVLTVRGESRDGGTRGGCSWVRRTRYQNPRHSRARKARSGIPRLVRVQRIDPVAHGPSTADDPGESPALARRPGNLEIESGVVTPPKQLTLCWRLEHRVHLDLVLDRVHLDLRVRDAPRTGAWTCRDEAETVTGEAVGAMRRTDGQQCPAVALLLLLAILLLLFDNAESSMRLNSSEHPNETIASMTVLPSISKAADDETQDRWDDDLRFVPEAFSTIVGNVQLNETFAQPYSEQSKTDVSVSITVLEDVAGSSSEDNKDGFTSVPQSHSTLVSTSSHDVPEANETGHGINKIGQIANESSDVDFYTAANERASGHATVLSSRPAEQTSESSISDLSTAPAQTLLRISGGPSMHSPLNTAASSSMEPQALSKATSHTEGSTSPFRLLLRRVDMAWIVSAATVILALAVLGGVVCVSRRKKEPVPENLSYWNEAITLDYFRHAVQLPQDSGHVPQSTVSTIPLEGGMHVDGRGDGLLFVNAFAAAHTFSEEHKSTEL